jgi:integrase
MKKGAFHVPRKTAIRNWFAERLREYEVMRLAGHSDFRTTHKYYLAVADSLKDRTREVTARGLCRKFVQIGARGVLASKQH